MAEIERFSPEEVRPRLQAGELLLVCAHDDEGKFRQVHLEGAISLAEFESRLPSLPKGQEVVFNCA